jgi:hypothetical protein
MRRPGSTALRSTLPTDPAPGAIKDSNHDRGGATANLTPAKKNRARGQQPTVKANYLVTTNLPEDPSITEGELRAIEVLLGGELNAIITGSRH